ERVHPDLESNTGSKTNLPPSTGQGWVAFSLSSAHGYNSARFIAGTALIAGSFLVYLAYPIILLILPFSPSIKVGAAVVVWFVSWGVFSAGIFLAGPEGFERFKGFWSRIISSLSWTKPDRRQLPDK
ncbi:MAG TPA: hypothetical protein VGA09_05315, partial [Candidatus Binatia bacterium]